MSPKFVDGHSLKRYASELLAGVIFDVYDQHTQIITELDVKLNKWHITVEKLYRKSTETPFFLNMTRQWDRTANLKRSRRYISHCASRQLGGSGLKRTYKARARIHLWA